MKQTKYWLQRVMPKTEKQVSYNFRMSIRNILQGDDSKNQPKLKTLVFREQRIGDSATFTTNLKNDLIH